MSEYARTIVVELSTFGNTLPHEISLLSTGISCLSEAIFYRDQTGLLASVSRDLGFAENSHFVLMDVDAGSGSFWREVRVGIVVGTMLLPIEHYGPPLMEWTVAKTAEIFDSAVELLTPQDIPDSEESINHKAILERRYKEYLTKYGPTAIEGVKHLADAVSYRRGNAVNFYFKYDTSGSNEQRKQFVIDREMAESIEAGFGNSFTKNISDDIFSNVERGQKFARAAYRASKKKRTKSSDVKRD